MTDPSSRRHDDIDVLRGLAILAVLVLHAGVMTPGLDARPAMTVLMQRLSYGIQLFFVLSGFLVCLSLDRCLRNGEGRRGFLIRRAAKIVPLYLLFLHINIGLYLVTASIAPHAPVFRNSVAASNLTVSNYLAHLAFFQGFTPAQMHTLLDGSWSIVIEVYFYLLFAAVLWRFCKTDKGSAWGYVLSLVTAMIFTVTIGRIHSGLSHYGFPAQLPCFMLGVLACRLMQHETFAKRFAAWERVTLAGAGLLMLGLIKGDTKPLAQFNVYALCFTALLLSSRSLAQLMPSLLRRTMSSLGRQSYALFFVHLVLLKVSYTLLAALKVDLPFWQALALNLIIALPLSWLLSDLVVDRIDRYFVARAARWLDHYHRKPADWRPA